MSVGNVTPKDEERFGKIEAEQSLIIQFIEDNKRLAARSDVLINAARAKKSREAEGETEEA